MVQFSIVVLLSSRSLSCCAGAFPYDSNVIVLLLALVLIWADRLPFRALCWNFRLFVFHHESDTITDSESFLDSSSASDNDDGDSQEALISATVATPNRQRDFHQAESLQFKTFILWHCSIRYAAWGVDQCSISTIPFIEISE
jgi:hypothetical protein